MRDAATMSFHLLRPLWLLALIPLAVVFAVLLRRQDVRAQWGGVIAPHLLTHLIVRPGQGRHVNPVYLVAAGMMLGIIGLSGPTWRRELPPFVEDKAPLMIALAVGSSMNETDVAPSRLERAKQKIRDLLAARAGARTGLVAFAGTAHLVMPPTDDRSVIEPFLAALGPGLMPADGKNVAGAVALAADALAARSPERSCWSRTISGRRMRPRSGRRPAAMVSLYSRSARTHRRCRPARTSSGSVSTARTSYDWSAGSRRVSRPPRGMRSARNGEMRAIGC
ncbi:VWA domain-containing protein, partial [Bradyrhizobium japonicum]|uniref:VWA domain-containing protein n=1 Tax=Bradyrhizobium japonicum TaxID=375 RepID=UPI0012FE1883